MFAFCPSFDALSEIQKLHSGTNFVQSYKLKPISLPLVKKITSGTDVMAFLVKALFTWNECSKNVDVSIFSNFLTIFPNCFPNIEKFCHKLSTCQLSIQLDHPSRNYRICASLAIPICKSPACLGLRDPCVTNELRSTLKKRVIVCFSKL